MHGSVEALTQATHHIKWQDAVDAIIIAGDFASINYEKNDKEILKEDQKISYMFSLLDELAIPYYFVWGNRDIFHFFYMMTIQNPDASHRHIENLQYGTFLTDTAVFPFKHYRITANPQRVNQNTLFVTHWQKDVEWNALLHLEGHVHFGQYQANCLNLGFLFRDSLHGAQQLLGGLWEIELSTNQITSVEYVYFGGNIKLAS